jgi:hypothetical protein
MGLHHFGSRSSYDDKNVSPGCNINEYDVESDCSTCEFKNLPNPDPSNYEIKRWKTIGGYLLIEINYPDCENYEGDKILLYKDVILNQLTDQKLIDPHFSNSDMFISPIARFRPDKNGWKMGIKLMEVIDGYR